MGKTDDKIWLMGEQVNVHRCDQCEQLIIGASYFYWEEKDFTICEDCISSLVDNKVSMEPPVLTFEIEDNVETRFEEFWLFYPKKVGKKDALRHFARLNKDKKFSFDDFVSGTKNYVEHCNKENRFLKDASAFVNQETYKDFLEMPAESINGKAYSKGMKNQSKTARNEELLDQMMGGIAKDDGRRNQRVIIDDQFDLS